MPVLAKTAVLTTVRGRHAHLSNQRRSLAAQIAGPQLHVVVSMEDAEVSSVVESSHLPETTTEVVPCPLAEGLLPLSQARNLGAQRAMERGAELLIFLDVDCVAEPGLVARYAELLTQAPSDRYRGPGPQLWCGPTGRLPEVAQPLDYPVTDPTALRGLTQWPVGRPVPAPGELIEEPDLTRFWSLNFALSSTDFSRIGGFDEAYLGYGGEDTDFAQRVRSCGGRMAWVGGAIAHHQWHTSHSPPWEHVGEVVRNGQVFAERWGWWPMTGWLKEFEAHGLVVRDSVAGGWRMPG